MSVTLADLWARVAGTRVARSRCARAWWVLPAVLAFLKCASASPYCRPAASQVPSALCNTPARSLSFSTAAITALASCTRAGSARLLPIGSPAASMVPRITATEVPNTAKLGISSQHFTAPR